MSCEAGFYKSLLFGCKPCHATCYTCTDSGKYNCLSCPDNRPYFIKGNCLTVLTQSPTSAPTVAPLAEQKPAGRSTDMTFFGLTNTLTVWIVLALAGCVLFVWCLSIGVSRIMEREGESEKLSEIFVELNPLAYSKKNTKRLQRKREKSEARQKPALSVGARNALGKSRNISTSRSRSTSSRRVSGRKPDASAAAAAAAAATVDKAEWLAATDPESGKTYYHNPVTKEVTWEQPDLEDYTRSGSGSFDDD